MKSGFISSTDVYKYLKGQFYLIILGLIGRKDFVGFCFVCLEYFVTKSLMTCRPLLPFIKDCLSLVSSTGSKLRNYLTSPVPCPASMIQFRTVWRVQLLRPCSQTPVVHLSSLFSMFLFLGTSTRLRGTHMVCTISRACALIRKSRLFLGRLSLSPKHLW